MAVLMRHILLFILLIPGLFHAKAQQQQIDSLKNLLKTQKKDSVYVDMLNDIGFKYSMFMYDSTLAVANRALRIAKQIKYDEGEANAFRLVSRAHRNKGNYREALFAIEQMLAIAKRLNNTKLISQANNDIGLVYKLQGEFSKALESYQNALRLGQRSSDSSRIAATLNNIGNLYREQDNLDKALEYFFQSLAVREKTHDQPGLASVLGNIGFTYSSLNDFEKGKRYLSRSIAIFDSLGDKSSVGINLEGMGQLHVNEKKYQEAITVLLRALKIHTEAQKKSYIVSIHPTLAKAYIGTGNLDVAESYCHQGLALAKEIGNRLRITELCELLVIINEKKGRYAEALKFQKMHGVYKDSLVNDETKHAIVKLEAKYEYDNELLKKDAEYNQQKIILEEEAKRQRDSLYVALVGMAFIVVMLLIVYINLHRQRALRKIVELKNFEISVQQIEIMKKNKELESINNALQQTVLKIENQNKQITQQAAHLRELNFTKDKLFSIISHDFRGPINSLKAALDMVSSKTFSPEDFLQVSGNLKKDVAHIQFSMSNLFVWATNQRNGIQTVLQPIDIGEIVGQNLNLHQAQAKAKSIEITKDFESKLVGWADREQINLILRNLISNAIKFTPAGGKVSIGAESLNKEIIITVADTGIGVDNEVVNKILAKEISFTSSGTKGEKGTGLGLLLCLEMIEKNNGRLWFEKNEIKGTKVKISIPRQNGREVTKK